MLNNCRDCKFAFKTKGWLRCGLYDNEYPDDRMPAVGRWIKRSIIRSNHELKLTAKNCPGWEHGKTILKGTLRFGSSTLGFRAKSSD